MLCKNHLPPLAQDADERRKVLDGYIACPAAHGGLVGVYDMATRESMQARRALKTFLGVESFADGKGVFEISRLREEDGFVGADGAELGLEELAV